MTTLIPIKQWNQYDKDYLHSIVAYSKHILTALYSRIWGKIILSYVKNLNNYKRKNQSARNIKVGDYVIYSGLNKEMSPINEFQICEVLEVIKGRNGKSKSPNNPCKNHPMVLNLEFKHCYIWTVMCNQVSLSIS